MTPAQRALDRRARGAGPPPAASVLGLIAVLALTGCGGSGGDSHRIRATTLAEGGDRAMVMVEATIARVGRGREVSDGPPFSATPCDTALGGPSGNLFSENYGKRLSLRSDEDADDLLRSTSEYWKAHGYAPYTRDFATRVPVVFARTEGFSLSLQVVRDKGLGDIGASTPCLPRR